MKTDQQQRDRIAEHTRRTLAFPPAAETTLGRRTRGRSRERIASRSTPRTTRRAGFRRCASDLDNQTAYVGGWLNHGERTHCTCPARDNLPPITSRSFMINDIISKPASRVASNFASD